MKSRDEAHLKLQALSERVGQVDTVGQLKVMLATLQKEISALQANNTKLKASGERLESAVAEAEAYRTAQEKLVGGRNPCPCPSKHALFIILLPPLPVHTPAFITFFVFSSFFQVLLLSPLPFLLHFLTSLSSHLPSELPLSHLSSSLSTFLSSHLPSELPFSHLAPSIPNAVSLFLPLSRSSHSLSWILGA